MLKITVLNDNAPKNKFASEHGLSYIVEADKKILFDFGPSNIFIKNAKLLNINFDDIDTLVLSHGHWDHGNGLKYLKNKKLITHPDSFQKKHRKKDNSYLGLPFSKKIAEKKFELILSKGPFQISKEITFLGEIPRLNNFEAKSTDFILDNGEDDFVMDDSAISVLTEKGLVVVAGCSHSGICNIIEYAKKLSGIENVYGVIGGFHLKHNDNQTKKTILYFKQNNIQKIFPSHCTALPALSQFYNAFKIEQIHSGDIVHF
ncbi:MAG: MBL fold metallo-hydrolase [Bacteroidales bacterium]|nr:MBL fold metallo-hydrolase [Bacteroidales bacterium]MBN2758406.1 MBL fold metallo-hydrolase [Bacteroidales bacterium]